MSDDQTEYQSAGGKSTSQELSLQATTPPSDVPGYRLSNFLGSGAFGQVWVGRDLNTGRSVAVKFYLHRGGVNWSLLSREVKNLVQLSADRQVVQVLEVGWDADPPYYVMELVTGGSLEDLLKRRGRLSVSESVKMFRQICVGLNHCHAKGVLHCDLKPANILIGDEDEPRLADFGQSRLSTDQTPALGTLFYMAPEQADLKSTPNASWDVYAVGAILYRMLTGAPPYRDETIVDQIDTAGSLPKRLQRYRDAIKNSPPPTLHKRKREVDRQLAAIVSRCLAADPSVRYENVQQILEDLARRESDRARRPLLLLGIVGPLAILMATMFFGFRSIKQASTGTKEALRKEAFGSNQLAATFAAQTLESEIEDYYDLTRDEAAMPEFTKQLGEVLEDPEINRMLDQVAAMQTPAQTQVANAAREELLDATKRVQLDKLLKERLSRYTSAREITHKPRLATMFVTDRRGTIIGIAYGGNVERAKNSAGRNFCYRTYFHGGKLDLPKNDVIIGQVQPLTQTHLSAAFPSTATSLWKVAVSTPIYLSGDDDQSESEINQKRDPDAIFVVTINLGDFELLQSEQGANQVAVLVEAREGPARGTILQHPLMDQRRSMGVRYENEKYQIDNSLMDEILSGGDVNFLDPLAKADDGKDYAGEWIAAMQPAELPRPEREAVLEGDRPTMTAGKTDLLVLVQYRLEKVWAPVDLLKTTLLLDVALAIGSNILIVIVLWYFVRRVDEKPLESDSGNAESVIAQPEETVTAAS